MYLTGYLRITFRISVKALSSLFTAYPPKHTMRNIIEIREIRESNYEISEFVHTLFQKVRKRVQHLEFHQKCVMTLAVTDFLNSFPIICKSLHKLCKSGKVFIVVQLRTFCTSIQELVMFLVNSNFFVNICRFI